MKMKYRPVAELLTKACHVNSRTVTWWYLRGSTAHQVRDEGRGDVPVEEHDVLLPCDEEEGVTQFRELGHQEDEDPEGGDVVGAREAHGGVEALAKQEGTDFADSTEDADQRQERESRVPREQQPLEVEGLARSHPGLTDVDGWQVEQDGSVGQQGTSGGPALEEVHVVPTLVLRVKDVRITPDDRLVPHDDRGSRAARVRLCD